MKAQHAEVSSQLEAAQAEIALRDTLKRRGSFAKAIASEAGLANRDAVERLLPSLGLENDAPESYGKAEVSAAIKALEGVVPELFVSNSTTRKPPPGGGRAPDPNSDEFWREQAKRDNQRGPATAYEAAKGA